MLQRLWNVTKDIGDIFWPARFSIGVLIVSVPFLWMLEPSQDALLAVVSDWSKVWLAVLFAVSCLLWAFETFYWAWFMSGQPAHPAPRIISAAWVETLNDAFPFWLGFLALISVGGATVKANWGSPEHAIGVLMVLLVALFIYTLFCAHVMANRRTLVASALMNVPAINQRFGNRPTHRQLFTQVAPPGWPKWLAGLVFVATLIVYATGGNANLGARQAIAAVLAGVWLICGVIFVSRIERLQVDQGGMRRMTKFWILLNFILFAAIFGISIYAGPVLMTVFQNQVTAPLVMMTVLSAWVFVGSFFIALPAERTKLPIATTILVASIFLSLFFRDNHDIRVAEDAPLPPSAPLAATFDQWYRQWEDGDARKQKWKGGKPPLVIIATAGGASRAGYWTAKVLSELEDAHKGFHKYVFAISSVSGGSLGAGLWRAMIEDAKAPCGDTFAGCARRFFCQDFLGPTFLDGLYADLAQRLLPGHLLPDRAVALEQSWEIAWSHIMKAAPERMSRPFHDMQSPADDWRPLLLINGTSEKTGRRIITSSAKIDEQQFPDALDFFDVFGGEVPLSTAIHNSARFTYIDAAGNIDAGGRKESSPTDRILDGGYFENFGATTAFDVLRALRGLEHDDRPFRPILIQISSDPDLATQEERNKQWLNELDASMNIASDEMAPLLTLYNVRDAQGVRATEVVEQIVHTEDGADPAVYAKLRLTDRTIPMSWAMSSFAIGAIDTEWGVKKNQEALTAISGALWPGMPVPTGSKVEKDACVGNP